MITLLRMTTYRNITLTIAGLLFGAIILWGCAAPAATVEPPPELPAAFPNHSADDITRLIRSDADRLNAFSARAQLAIDSPSQRGSYAATIRSRRADSLFLSVGQFGFEGLRALVTPDSFFVYDLLRNRLTYGGVDQAAASLPIPVGGDDVFRSLLGTIVPDADTDWRLNAGGRFYTMTHPPSGRTVVVDPSIWRVIRYEERAPSGDLLEERLFSDFAEFDGVLLPRHVAINMPEQDTRVTLVYRSIALNPAALDFSLRVNRQAERVPAGG